MMTERWRHIPGGMNGYERKPVMMRNVLAVLAPRDVMENAAGATVHGRWYRRRERKKAAKRLPPVYRKKRFVCGVAFRLLPRATVTCPFTRFFPPGSSRPAARPPYMPSALAAAR